MTLRKIPTPFFAIMLILFSFILASPSIAQDNDNAVLASLTGQWHSEGIAFGQQAISRMIWSTDLNNKFYKIDYAIEMNTGTKKASNFTGLAYYKQNKDGTYKAFWADNSGDLHPITAVIEENSLVSIWGVKGEKMGRTSYELLSPDEVRVTDWIMRNDAWQQFNQNVFTRIAP